MIERRDFRAGMVLIVLLAGGALMAVLLLATASLNEPAITENCVAVVPIEGGIYAPRQVVDQLERYIEHKRVKAIVIRLDTPGGGVAATQEIYATVLKAKAQGKPVIASMGTVAASGGYYVASACDTIMANPATITGSIGVIAMFPVLAGLYEKIGIDYEVVKTGQFKDTGSTFRELTPEERDYMNGLINDMFEQFIGVVSEQRGMTIEQVRTLADGRVFTGRQALGNGLVDTLGTYQDAIDLAGEIAGLGKNPPVYEESRFGFWNTMIDGVQQVIRHGAEMSVPTLSYQMSF